MGMITSVIGIDPGPTTGVCFLDYPEPLSLGPVQIEIFQMEHSCVEHFLDAYIAAYYNRPEVVRKFAQVEKFTTGNSAGTKGKKAELTRQCVMRYTEKLQLAGYKTVIEPNTAKTWASDKRLERLGVTASKTSLVHGRDAARHAMYCAVKHAGRKDPLA
jgi:hypothetical protein